MTRDRPPPDDALTTRTRVPRKAVVDAAAERVPALTVLAHADPDRIGERATLLDLHAGEPVSVSRVAPSFGAIGPSRTASRPLADPFLSRNAIVTLSPRDGAILLERARPDSVVGVDGAPLDGARAISAEELSRGVVIELSDRAALLLHLVDATRGRAGPGLDLVGDSDAIHRLRREIARVAPTDLRVLILGETGSGKELCARAIHAASRRAAGPCLCVNIATVQPSLAASALFGHVRGAFSGAVADHDGHFHAAHGGTLFLDEIGDADLGVQPMLLRALETGKVQGVGDRRERAVDVRLLAATDADLDAAVGAGRFREPLLHRLAELVLRVPPLRARRDDIGRLVRHFAREALGADADARLRGGEVAERSWLSASVVARLARAPWPGNVRQLRNVVRQLVVLGRDDDVLSIGPAIEAMLGDAASRKPSRGEAAGEPEQKPSARGRERQKRAQAITDDEIVAALEKTGFRRDAAADLLGIARSTLYARIERSPRVRKAHELTRREVEAALARHDADLARAAAELHVSAHGLKLRIQALGLADGRRSGPPET